MRAGEIAALAVAAFLAGAINAIAGGGTLLTFPALLFFGTREIVANATSTLALVIGTGGSLYGFRARITAVRPWLIRFVPPSLLGGWLGSVLLTRTGNETFAKLIPYLLLFSTLLFLSQGVMKRLMGAASHVQGPSRRGVWVAIGFQFAVAVYGGYFGAGIGILMLASLGFLGLNDIHEMNTLKNILGSLINLVAAIWFVICGLIDWPRMCIMAAAAVAGYFLGASFSLRIPQKAVRRIVTAIGFAISAILFWKQFAR